jgi:hypothetical protein
MKSCRSPRPSWKFWAPRKPTSAVPQNRRFRICYKKQWTTNESKVTYCNPLVARAKRFIYLKKLSTVFFSSVGDFLRTVSKYFHKFFDWLQPLLDKHNVLDEAVTGMTAGAFFVVVIDTTFQIVIFQICVLTKRLSLFAKKF